MSLGTPRRSAATIPDVATLAGVSRATAARALGGYGSVSPDARAKVLVAAETLGYQANGVARSMITGRTMSLGVVVGDIENDFFSRVTRGFTDVAHEAGFDAVIANTDEKLTNERAAVRLLLERRVDGLMVAPASMIRSGHLRDARASGAHVVLVDRRVPRLGLDTILIDNVAAARHAVQELTRVGHRRIGLVTGVSVDTQAGTDPETVVSTSADRLLGYQEALAAAGIAYDPTLVGAGDFHLEAARERTTALLQVRDRPTALFATDSVLALGALLAVRDVGLDCPEDVSLVAFDDPDWASVVRPRLSVMAQPAQELGAAAARRLLARVHGETARAGTTMLSATWRPRESVSAPRHRAASRARARR
jgi:LacI family transcriptional regulator